ncbi:MAG: nucleotidyltransferase family protein [Mycobacterium sp.]
MPATDVDSAIGNYPRLVVVGSDADLAAVLTQLLRADQLDVEVDRRINNVTSPYSTHALATLRKHRVQIAGVLAKYGASNPQLFGSVAQGTAGPNSDIDILLDLPENGHGSRLARLAGIRIELEELLHLPVDVAFEELLKDGVSAALRQYAIALHE